MTEPTTPEQQDVSPVQQAPDPQHAPAEDWKKRYDGLVKKTETLVTDQRRLEAELAAKASELEQLNGQLGIKDIEKSAAVSERDKTIQELIAKGQSADTELARLRAMQLKLEVVNELKRPELIKILGHIPDLADKEALKVVMADFAGFADELVKARETQLLSGVIPAGGGNPPPSSKPGSDDEWKRFIEEAPLGSREKAKRMDEYGDWLMATHRR